MSRLLQLLEDAERYLTEHGGVPTEFDQTIDQISREIPYAMEKERGSCWLVAVNLNGEDRVCRDAIAKKLEPNVCVGSYVYAVPEISEEFIDAIYERCVAPYEGSMKDFQRVLKIEAIAQKLEAVDLI